MRLSLIKYTKICQKIKIVTWLELKYVFDCKDTLRGKTLTEKKILMSNQENNVLV